MPLFILAHAAAVAAVGAYDRAGWERRGMKITHARFWEFTLLHDWKTDTF